MSAERGERSAEKARHVVRIMHDAESHEIEDCHDDCTAQVICAGVTDACRTWWECARCRAVAKRLGSDYWLYDERLDERGDAHGKEHQQIDGSWMTPSSQCLSGACEEDDARDLVPTLADGDYPVSIDWDEGYLMVTLSPVSPTPEAPQ